MALIMGISAALGIADLVRRWRRDKEEEPIRQARIAKARQAATQTAPAELDYDDFC
jgi:hypothetical protein